MPSIAVMLKPASGLCNMRCRYCFYDDEVAARDVACYGIMSEDVLRAVLARVLDYATDECTIAFQGGEPTLAGLPFFRRLIELERELNVHGASISHALQTNGYALDDAWASFFAEHDFLVGVSIDGDRDIHDANRVDVEGKGTFDRVMASIDLLKRHGVRFNALSVVTEQSARRTQSICRFFDRRGIDYRQFIPCLDPLGEEPGGHAWSLSPEAFELHLKASFNGWHRDAMQGDLRYHRFFVNLLNILDGRPAEACDMCGVCGRQLVVEADGSVYPCDFYMLDEYRLGNLATDSLEQIERARNELGFIQMSAAIKKECAGCRWEGLCRGGCRRYWEPIEGGDAKAPKNRYCEAYRGFFDYAYPKLVDLLALLRGR
ncbi:radical SAM/SPASM domain-containing protein [Rubneribacter badeniensis]|uniref:radical SAM/SPASM domain-containing protein n=1 Tax=Rubneribacter badeniensis TaxID=2070688 RepID=UPI000B372B9C|nr:anaerobic sulfatase maturase [Gordonibacter sp. An232A]